MNGKKVERQGGKSPRTNHPHAEVVPDPERLPFIAAIRWQMHLFPAFRPDGPERNLRFAPFTRTPPHRTAWAAPEGGCPIPVLPFLCLLCKSFQRTTPPRAHGPLEGESGRKGSTKKADGQKKGGLFWAGRGKFSQKQTKRRAGGKRGALPYGPHTGRAAGTGRGPERGAEGAYSAKHWKMRKRITRRKGPCRAERGRKREGTAKGARRRRKRAELGKPEGPDERPARALPNRREAPTGEEREGKGKGEGARAPPPRTAKVRGKKAECKRGKKKQDKENGRERRAENPGRKHGQKAQGDGKGKACQIFRRDTWQAGKRKGIFYIRIIHKPHQYRIHLHRHHPYDKDYNLPAGRISRRGHTPMLDRHIPFSYI